MRLSAERRDLLNDALANFFGILEAHPRIQSIEITDQVNSTLSELNRWERMNKSYPLPYDLRAFYLLSNGLRIQWKVQVQNQILTIGRLNFCPLDQLVLYSIPNEKGFNRQDPHFVDKYQDQNLAGVVLDTCHTVGQIVLLYADETTDPEIWLYDRSGQWHFLASTFTAYLRLAVLHFGIIGWQQIFQPAGLDPITTQWMQFFLPGRAAYDQAMHVAKSSSNNI